MARARSIKPGFFDNTTLGQLPPLARLLFSGLWCHADRAGRLEDDPTRLKVKILPFDRCNIDSLLNLLASVDDPFIIRYTVGSKKFIQIAKWDKHQNPHVKEVASSIPAPCENCASTVQEPDSHSSKTPCNLNPEPLTLNPEPGTLNPEPLTGNPELGGGNLVHAADAAPPLDPVQAVATELHEATAARVDLGLAGRLCRESATAGVHPLLTCRWIRAKAEDRKNRGDPIRVPKLFLDDWPVELRLWVKSNLAALVGGRYALIESPACPQCSTQQFVFEDGTIVRCKCTGKRALGLVRA